MTSSTNSTSVSRRAGSLAWLNCISVIPGGFRSGTQSWAIRWEPTSFTPTATIPWPHRILTCTIATYVMGLMYYSVLTGQSPIGLSGDAYDFGDAKDEALRHALQSVVWDVVRAHPYSGVKGQASGASKTKRRKTPATPAVIKRPGSAKLSDGTVSIARWKDDKTAAVTIFSSDGMIRSIKSEWTPQGDTVLERSRPDAVAKRL